MSLRLTNTSVVGSVPTELCDLLVPFGVWSIWRSTPFASMGRVPDLASGEFGIGCGPFMSTGDGRPPQRPSGKFTKHALSRFPVRLHGLAGSIMDGASLSMISAVFPFAGASRRWHNASSHIATDHYPNCFLGHWPVYGRRQHNPSSHAAQDRAPRGRHPKLFFLSVAALRVCHGLVDWDVPMRRTARASIDGQFCWKSSIKICTLQGKVSEA